MSLEYKLKEYVTQFNDNDNELYYNDIKNCDAEDFMLREIPLISCLDKYIEETYYFRWWTFRKHIKNTEVGRIITEFLPSVSWSGPYNSINCPACFHIREGRWLRDSEDIVKNYINFWLDEIGNAHSYSSWLPHAVYEYCELKNDFDFAISKLPEMIKFYEKREAVKNRGKGLYYSVDDRDGMEFSIGGSGLRPTNSSYAYGDAVAIAKIAEIAGEFEVKVKFEQKAAETKASVDKFLWAGNFYKTLPFEENGIVDFTERPYVHPDNDARELVGYVPWYFNLPDNGKEFAFKELLDKGGFLAEYGITTTEQRHPRFMEKHSHECLWNGPVWPFATSQVLVAAANLIRNYDQDVFDKNDYFTLLSQYARSHKLTKEDGTVVSWIDENMHPYTGRWLARDLLIEHKCNIIERGKDYNHSLFCDLVLSGLFGISVKDGGFVCDPIIPDDWDCFTVENLWLNGARHRIDYKNGNVTIESY